MKKKMQKTKVDFCNIDPYVSTNFTVVLGDLRGLKGSNLTKEIYYKIKERLTEKLQNQQREL